MIQCTESAYRSWNLTLVVLAAVRSTPRAAQKRSEAMLVLSRKPGEKILVGNDVKITIIRIGPNSVRVGIDAPGHMNIVREELVEGGTEALLGSNDEQQSSGPNLPR
jgi:carbon storage regulator